MSQIGALKEALHFEADTVLMYYRADQKYESSRLLFASLTANRQRHIIPPNNQVDLETTYYGAVDLGNFTLAGDEQSENVRRLVAVPYEYRCSYNGLHLLGIQTLKLCNQPRDSNWNTQDLILDLTIPADDDKAYPKSQWARGEDRTNFIQFAGFMTEVLAEAELAGRAN